MSTPVSVPRQASASALTHTPAMGGGNRRAAVSTPFRTPTTATRPRHTPSQAGVSRAVQTPHARAARQALDIRRTALLTPGRQSRRRSGRMLRDSPRDLLRNLSRRLAPTSQAVASSSSPATGSSGSTGRRAHRQSAMDAIPEDEAGFSAWQRSQLYGQDDDDSIPLDQPRMSLPMGDDDDEDDDDDLQPHRSMFLDDDANVTLRSIEFARRTATQEQLRQARRFSRGSLGSSGSLGSIRMSDYMEGFLGGAVDDGEGGQQTRSAFFPEDAFDNLANEPAVDTTFERVDSDHAGADDRAETFEAGRPSEFGGPEVPLAGNETTFVMATEQQSPTHEAHGDADSVLLDGDDSSVPWFGDDDGAGAVDAADAANATDAATAVGPGDTTVLSGAGASSMKRDAPRDDVAPAFSALRPRSKRLKLSAHGIAYPSLPAGVVKRVAQSFAQSTGSTKAKFGADAVASLSMASDWFFEQVGIDLERYSKHAGRKTIDESDMLLLLRRQRQVGTTATPFSLAQHLLPRELLQELRMLPESNPRAKQGRRRQGPKARRTEP